MDFSRHIKPLTGETDWPMWKWKIRDLLDYHEGAIEVLDSKLKRPESIDVDAQESVKKLHKARCDLVPGEDVSTYIAKLRSLWNELNNGLEAREDSKLPDLMLVYKVLHILPCQFEAFKSSWMLLAGDDNKSFEELTVQLCMFERNFTKVEDSSQKVQEALIATKSERPKPEGKYGRPSKNKLSDTQSNTVSANIALMSISEEVCTSETSPTSYWIDNEATRHVTNYYTCFVDFIKFNSTCGIKAAGNETFAVIGRKAQQKQLYKVLLWLPNEVKKVLEHMFAHTRPLGYSVEEFLCDNSGEFYNKDVREILYLNGITQRLTAPYTPEQNEANERKMRTTIEMARTFKYSNPEDLHAMLMFQLRREGKWTKMPSKGKCDDRTELKLEDRIREETNQGKYEEQLIKIEDNPIKRTQSQEDLSDSETDGEEYAEPTSDRQLRNYSLLQKPKRFEDHIMEAESYLDYFILKHKEAANSKDSTDWKKAMESEMNSLNESYTWELSDLPVGAKAIPCKWVYRLKTNPDGSINKHKVRLVARGFSQRQGTDYSATYSPAAKLGTIRTVLSIADEERMHLTQFDVLTAFLYGDLEETIYMQQLEGFKDGPGRVCKLKYSLHGLKQSPRCWNKCFGQFLTDFGFKASEADPCLYIRERKGRKL
ncbi:retrovirus-related Pol polyprotein from transposon TNT 1-94 [Trichonephila inaurata madagascariensis]|uniref:Retrovirus-related Pol polyprotein from transposon TNT 1-94 n=1 Tax=Trichonephila inaurata madagascariensis TaxID=2747483 RepID=A0A8X7CQF0_9ARAC|nr:retrovirus-related Pol polyprotein from transposon TNT 1-94 [Trichonephila inaurata madagascariensis]